MAIGWEYTDNDVHFIAGGRTLALIRQYEWDKANPDKVYARIAGEYGGIGAAGSAESAGVIFAQAVDNQLFINPSPQQYKGTEAIYYSVNLELPEGRELAQRIEDVPAYELGFNRFAKRLTGAEETRINPDDLRDRGPGASSSPYNRDYDEVIAASYRKYGDTYVVSVPRVVRGIFNDAAAPDPRDGDVRRASGYTFEWFTPPDSQQIPFSKVVELRESILGDQLAPRVVEKPMGAWPKRKM